MKKFLIIGNQNALCYKEFFPYFKKGKVFTGYTFNKVMSFKIPEYYAGGPYCKVAGICWFSNLFIEKEGTIQLTKTYDPEEYPKYDNYDAINCDKVKDVPYDYDGAIGVPITILDKVSTGGIIHLNQEDYSIVKNMASATIDENSAGYPYINGKKKYARVIIKKKI